VPLAAAGAGTSCWSPAGKLPASVLTPVALYWAIAFPGRARAHAGCSRSVRRRGRWRCRSAGWIFVVFQVLLSLGFAIGYWWLHENFAPRWWFHLRDRNPVANFFIRHQLEYAAIAERERERKRSMAAAKAGRSK
jgi:hypothetical protein